MTNSGDARNKLSIIKCLLYNICAAEELHIFCQSSKRFRFLFDFTAAGVVQCGGRKTSPRTSTIVQFIFYFGPLR